MKTLAIACQKGGVGKTTLTVNLAAWAHRDGLAVAVADTDPQATCFFWSQVRTAPDTTPDIPVQSLHTALLKTTLAALKRTGCDLAIIDTPPVSKDTASAVIEQADFVLIPTIPSPFDLHAAHETIRQCRTLKKPCALVLTMVPPRHGPEVADAMETLAKQHSEVCPVLIHRAIAHPRAQTQGIAVHELDIDSLAAQEMKQLYRYTLKHLGLTPTPRRRAA